MSSTTASSPPRTWVLVLNYQGRDHIEACLDSLRAQESPPGGVRCAVIDNASSDGSLETVRRRFPELDVISNERNLGFAGGNNVGIRRAMEAGAEYVALLNMDATVDPRWLSRLVEAAEEHPDAALLGARIHSADGATIEFDGLQFDPVTTSGGYADRPAQEDSSSGVIDAAYACGAGLLMRTAAVAETGLFDETFFAYHEDVELALRCWMHGYRVVNVAGSIVYHAVGGAQAGAEFRHFMGARNVVLTLLKLSDARSWQVNGTALTNHFFNDQNPQHRRSLISALFEAPAALLQRRRMRGNLRRALSEVLRDSDLFETRF